MKVPNAFLGFENVSRSTFCACATRHVTYMNVSCHIYVCVVSHSWKEAMSKASACATSHGTRIQWLRPIGCLIFIGHSWQKSPIIIGSFARNDLQLRASYGSLPPCNASVLVVSFLRVRVDETRSIATHTCLSRCRKFYHRDWASGLFEGSCTQSAVGKYITGTEAVVCDVCPANSDSPWQSNALLSCTCNAGCGLSARDLLPHTRVCLDIANFIIVIEQLLEGADWRHETKCHAYVSVSMSSQTLSIQGGEDA